MTSPTRHCEERSNPRQADNGLCYNEPTSSRSWPREARYFCLDTKVPKKSSQQIGFFAHKPLPCKTDRTTGCNYFAPLRTRSPELLQKLAMPFPALRATIVLSVFARSLSADGNLFYHVMGNLSKDARRGLPTMLRRAQHDPFLNMSWVACRKFNTKAATVKHNKATLLRKVASLIR
ncbi:MAG: hypothetical protein JWQ57_3830 [Mucilaginibacter sp.]|nr:hypothetical protein [Mucilaginibacter sp.]